MTYFIEFYDRDLNHVGTRSLRATDATAAQAEAASLCRTTGCRVLLFEQPAKSNYRVLAAFA